MPDPKPSMISKIHSLFDYYKRYEEYPAPGKPEVLQFPINDICNSRCQMCNIWQQKKDKEITPAEIRQVLADPLFSELRNVGLNGGEPTLRRDIGEVAAAVVETLPKISDIHLITNAILFEKCAEGIRQISAVCRPAGVNLHVMVSLDGVGAVHDTIRGRPGNFESAVKLLDYVKSSDLADKLLIGCTMSRDNIYGMEDLLTWCRENGIHGRFRVAIPHQRLYSQDFPHPTMLDEDRKFHLANFLDQLRLHYEQDDQRQQFYRSLREQILHNTPRRAGCKWKSHGATLGPRGELAYCAVESKTLGNAIEQSPSMLYWENTDHLREIQETKCANCLHDYEGKMFPGDPQANAIKHLLRAAKKRVARHVKVRPKLNGALLQSQNGTGKSGFEEERVLLCGWYGTETLGDKAILGGICDVLRETSSAPMDLASIEPYVSQYTVRQMPEMGIEHVLSLDEAVKQTRRGRYSTVIFAGGPLMSTIDYIQEITQMFRFVKARGGSGIIAGCGVGPLSADFPENNRAIHEILSTADRVILRDSVSEQATRKFFWIDRDIEVACDPAMIWLENLRAQPAPERGEQILLALRDWPIAEYARTYTQSQAESLKAEFENQLRVCLRQLQEALPDTRLIPFCMHKLAVGGDDRFFYHRLLRDLPEVRQNLDMRHRLPAEDARLFQQSRLVLAMRFHSAVFSLGTRTPFFAIDYTMGGKVRGLLEDLSLTDNLLELKNFNGAEVANAMIARYQNPPAAPEIDDKGARQIFSRAFADIAAAKASPLSPA